MHIKQDPLHIAKYILYYVNKNKKYAYRDITGLDLQNILNDIDTEYFKEYGQYLTDRTIDNYNKKGYEYWYSTVYYKYCNFGAMHIWKVHKSLKDLKEYHSMSVYLRKFIQRRVDRYLCIRYLTYGY